MTRQLIGNIEGSYGVRVNDEVVHKISKVINRYYEQIKKEPVIANEYRVMIKYLEKGTNKVL